MNKKSGLFLLVYSLPLAGLSYLVYHLAPQVAMPTLIAGSAGGLFSLVWGVRALIGREGKLLPILTLIPVTFVLLAQTLRGWSDWGGLETGRTVAGVITLLFVLSFGMLLRIAWSGVLFDVQNRPNHQGK